MEFDFNIEKSLGGVSSNGVAFLDASHPPSDYKNVSHLLDVIGDLSARAQDLPSVITTGSKFFCSDQHLFIMCKGNVFIGFIKVGHKHLFIYDEVGGINELNPLCVLDFYTYEKCQRKGYGKIIFNEMLEREKIEPRKLGYDRPSNKFINFLKKYYGLENYVPQNNNYIVFKKYFDDVPKKKDKYDIYNNNNFDFNLDDNKENYKYEKNVKNNNKNIIRSNKNNYYNYKNKNEDNFDTNSEMNKNKMKNNFDSWNISGYEKNYKVKASSSEYGSFFFGK